MLREALFNIIIERILYRLSFSAADVDYDTVSASLMFVPGGATSMCLDVDINEDIIGENNEVFTLILTGAQTPDQATVTIIDNGEVLN